MMNFKEFFEEKERKETLYKINANSCVDFYCGFDENNSYCMAIRTRENLPIMDSTKLLKIEQKADLVPDTYWIYISLIDSEAKNVFFSFCNDILDTISNQNDFQALCVALKNRINCWKKLFSKTHKPLSAESIKGLTGEFLFIDKFLSPIIGIKEAIKSWSGPLGTSKDFAYKEFWFEIKTIAAQSPTVKINSLNQLFDINDGYLVVYKAEETSQMFSSDTSDVMTIYENILKKISELGDQELYEIFFDKLAKIGFAPDEDYKSYKYKIYDPIFYKVNKDFPRLTEENVKFQEIAKISYELILKMIEKYRSEPWKL